MADHLTRVCVWMMHNSEFVLIKISFNKICVFLQKKIWLPNTLNANGSLNRAMKQDNY